MADPQVSLVSDIQCTNFTVACDTRHKDSSGNKLTNFYRVAAWRKTGELCSKYLHKADRVAVSGDLLLRSYVDKNGTQRYELQVTATDVEFLTPKTQDSDQASTTTSEPANLGYAEDELPF